MTFLLAVVGYAGLTATAVVAARGRMLRPLWLPTVAVIVVHVFLVWSERYEWQIAAATRNGYAGFVIFHGALAMILVSVVAADRLARVLVVTAFGIVTLGAVGAVFRYEVVEIYRVPVLIVAVAGTMGTVRAKVVKQAKAVKASPLSR
jgi:hypothetical protein